MHNYCLLMFLNEENIEKSVKDIFYALSPSVYPLCLLGILFQTVQC